MKERKQSLGELISTACFAGVGIFWLLYGMEYFRSGEHLKSILMFVFSIFCFLGSIRYKIAAIFEKIVGNGSKN
jgi:exosortase/archaeosortase